MMIVSILTIDDLLEIINIWNYLRYVLTIDRGEPTHMDCLCDLIWPDTEATIANGEVTIANGE